MRWRGPGCAPATPDPATLARLAALPGLWTPWEDAVTRALQRTQLELQRRAFWHPHEFPIKSWAVVAHTAAGRQARAVPPCPPCRPLSRLRPQAERVLVATDRALYRCAFSYANSRLGEARRVEWSQYAQVQVGPFCYESAAWSNALGDWLLRREVDSVCACPRIGYHSQPARASC